MRYDDESIPDRSRPGLPTIASGVARQGTCGNYATTEHNKNKRRKRGGRRVKRQRKVCKGRRTLVRVGTLNIGKITGRARLNGEKECRHTVPTGNKVERE